MIYASYSKGYRAGNYNARTASPQVLRTVVRGPVRRGTRAQAEYQFDDRLSAAQKLAAVPVPAMPVVPGQSSGSSHLLVDSEVAPGRR